MSISNTLCLGYILDTLKKKEVNYIKYFAIGSLIGIFYPITFPFIYFYLKFNKK